VSIVKLAVEVQKAARGRRYAIDENVGFRYPVDTRRYELAWKRLCSARVYEDLGTLLQKANRILSKPRPRKGAK